MLVKVTSWFFSHCCVFLSYLFSICLNLFIPIFFHTGSLPVRIRDLLQGELYSLHHFIIINSNLYIRSAVEVAKI